MTGQTSSPGDQYAHLRANAAAQKRATVDRLNQAITQLEAEGCPVNTFTIKEVSGMDYMAYYRNREAFQLFQEHSTHLRKEREREQEKVRQLLTRSRCRRATHCSTTSARAWLNSCTRPALNETKPGDSYEWSE